MILNKTKIVRITTIPVSLEKLLEGQLAFMSKEFEVIAISSEEDRLKEYGFNEGVRVFPLELTRKITPITDIKSVYKLYRFLKKEKPLIVHTHTPKAGIVGMMAGWLANVPIRLHTVAGLPLMEAIGFKRKVLNLVEKLTYGFATKVYPNSKGLYDFIVSEKFAKPAKLSIIGKGSSNGIDTAYFDPSLFNEQQELTLKEQIAIPFDDFVFVYVGRMVGDKGINELIEAFKEVSSNKSNVSLLLVGPFENDLDPLHSETLQALKSHKKIFAVGLQNDVRPYLSIADVLTFPSYREGFPNVVMQAGAMGLPSIVSNINGCNEIIENGKNGIIISPKNIVELKNTMQQLIENVDLFKNLKNNSRRMIVERYQREEIWSALMNEYQVLKSSIQ
ncbi:glycosyltransferase family 4 protein [Aequorivita antarctica]|uniref:glycosyltransferase family 4 protein n=1 Tax=Aequorivita antarctica TaxID=153266 RepID=UPI000DBBF10D|nr:glycosyltransferase family 4 protein [Aequorivita antarctica]SRX75861.1 N, N'-diacetylbacillosaminyl-diphospho-undecaprenol alpha-1,3-N-acetylgalactosaminyltransferase [Aequorivita antarctica]